MKRESNLMPCVLLRSSIKTGMVDTTMVGLGTAMMRLWAFQNTPKTKECYIISSNGMVEFIVRGGRIHYDRSKAEIYDQLTCDGIGIPIDTIKEIIKEDGRFEEEMK